MLIPFFREKLSGRSNGVLLLLLVLLTYNGTLAHGFMLDDYCVLFAQDHYAFLDFVQLSARSFEKHIYFRPLAHLYLYVVYHLFGAHAIYYQCVQFFLFWVCLISFKVLVERLTHNRRVALLAAVLFCVHPINSIFLNYKTAVVFLIMVLSMNLSLISFLKWEEGGRSRDYAWSLLGFVLALLFHEVVMFFPLYVTAILLFNKGYSLRRTIAVSGPFWAVLGVYVVFRLFAMNLVDTVTNTAHAVAATPVTYLSSLAQLYGWYIARLFILEGIVFIWNAGTVSHPYLWIAGLAAGLILTATVVVKWRRHPAALFLAWFLIALAPVTLASLTRKGFGVYIEPHWLPYAVLSFTVLVALALTYLYSRIKPIVWKTGVALLIVWNIIYSMQYTVLWGNQKRYCLYWVSHAPDNFWVNNWLGLTYLSERNYVEARKYFEKIIALGIHQGDCYGNLGIIAYELKDYDLALQYFRISDMLWPHQEKTRRYIERILTLQNATPLSFIDTMRQLL